MKGWHLGAAALAVIGVALFVGVPYGRAIKFQFACDEAVQKLTRFPTTADEILALGPAIKAQAPEFKVDPAKLDVKVGLRSVDGGGAKVYFARVEVRHDGRYHAHERQIDAGKVNFLLLEGIKDGGGYLISGNQTFVDAPPPDDDE